MNSTRLAMMVVAWSLITMEGCKDMGIAPSTGKLPPDNPPPSGEVSFSRQVLPILTVNGCTGCHGGSGGLFMDTIADLLAGGSHGPAIVPGNGAGSNLVRKLTFPPPFGERMPLGGAQLPDSTITTIRTWINQGALNN